MGLLLLKDFKPVFLLILANLTVSVDLKNGIKLFCLGCRDEFNVSNPPAIENRYNRVFNEDVYYQMVNILKGVIKRGTGKKLKKLKLELAGKTGIQMKI